jgi:hypothetical protein
MSYTTAHSSQPMIIQGKYLCGGGNVKRVAGCLGSKTRQLLPSLYIYFLEDKSLGFEHIGSNYTE